MKKNIKDKTTRFEKFLNFVERNGNRLPDPVTLFVAFSVIILLVSAIASMLGVKAVNPADNETVEAVNLLTSDGLVKILTEFVDVFITFPPLGLVLVVMFGIGIAESTGLTESIMKVTIMKSPKKLVVPMIVFVGIMGNVAGDAAFIVIPPLAAMVFYSLNRHPLAGLALGYASVAGGFTANLLINTTDVVLVGFTQSAAELIDPSYVANPAMNYYFITASTVMLIPLAVWINNKLVEPHLGNYNNKIEDIDLTSEITAKEKKALICSMVSVILFIILLLISLLPEGAPLRNPETGAMIDGSPFMASIVPLTMLLFFIPSVIYGLLAGKFKSDKDIVQHLNKAISGMGTFIVFALVASQMIAFFNWSNLGLIISIKCANFIEGIGLKGLPLILLFILISSLINILISSNAAKWAILSPIFVPMFMLMNIDPALTQVAYRIGDSITNPITPMMAYFIMVLTFARKYESNIGIGRFMSLLIPYSIVFAIGWIIFIIIWYVIGIPIGPGYGINLK